MLSATVALLTTGLVQSLISPPFNWVALHPFVWIPAFWVYARLEGRRAFFAGWLVGTSANLAIFYWLVGTMVRFGGLPLPLATLVWLLFAAAVGFHCAVFAWGFARIRRLGGRYWPVAIAVWFCALEFLQPQLFGYLQGVAWYQHPRIFLVSALAGVSALSFLVILCNAVACQALEAWRDGIGPVRSGVAVNAGVLAALLVIAAVYSSARLQKIAAAEAEASALRIAVVQPNHTIARRRDLNEMPPGAFAQDLLELSRAALEQARSIDRMGGLDVYVWPEGALRVDPSQPRNRSVLEFVRDTGAEVWTGANHYEYAGGSDVRAHNSAFRIYGDGVIDERYDKNVLVPFGEYVPLRDVIPGFDRLPTVGAFEAGTTVPVYRSGKTTFAFLICYEAILPGFVRRAITDDVNLLTNVTVDAWYGDTSEQSQHLMLAAIQSALHGLPLIRATTTGISAVVDARGMLVARTSKFSRETTVGIVRPVRVRSLYSRCGDWLAWSFVVAAGLMILRAMRPVAVSPIKS